MTSLSATIPYDPHGDVAEGALFDMSRLDHPYRPMHVPLVVLLMLLGMIVFGLHRAVYGDGFSDSALAVYCWLYLAVTVVWAVAKALRPPPHNWLSPDVVFWLIYTMFHVPYVVFYLVGLADYTTTVFHTTDSTNRAMCVVVLSGIGFLIGYELGPLGRRQPGHFAPASRISPLLFQAGQVLFLVTFLTAAFALTAGLGSAILAQGYGGFRRIERYVSPQAQRWIVLAVATVRIGIVVYLAGCIMHHRKIVRGVLIPALLVAVMGSFLILGARTQVAVVMLPLIIGYHYFVKRIRLWVGVPLFLGALILFGVVGIGRSAKSLAPADIYTAYKEYRADTGVNPFVASLAESGSSFKTVNVVCAFIPNTEPFWYGKSLLDSALMIIPSPAVGLRTHITPSAWVTGRATGKIGGERAGWGSSIAMEGYLNFGMIGGVVFMMVIGFMMRRIYDTTLRRPSFLRVCLMLIAITGLALWCRNYSHHFFRPVVWTMAVAWLTWSFFGGRAQAVHAGPAGRRLT
jgi:hypothetical protein